LAQEKPVAPFIAWILVVLAGILIILSRLQLGELDFLWVCDIQIDAIGGKSIIKIKSGRSAGSAGFFSTPRLLQQE
jgi:hypothetical protein